jgi:HK97 family phage portal protein
MNVIQRIFNNILPARQSSTQTVTGIKAQDEQFWLDFFNQGTSNAVTVTPTSSMKSATVYSVVDRKTSTLAALPIKIERKTGKGRELDTAHDQYYLLTKQPHPNYTAYIFWRTMYANYLTMGDGFAKIWRNPVTSRPFQYELQDPADIDVYTYTRDDGQKAKYYKNNKTSEIIWPENMLHFSDLNLKGLRGFSKISLHASSIGYDMSATILGKKLFENGTFMGGYLKYPQVLDAATLKKYRESFNEIYSGMQNAGKVGALDGGSEYVPLKMSMPLSDIAFIESRNLQKEDIAMIFNYPVEMLSPQKSQSANGIEQVMIQYVMSSVTPFATMVEQELTSKIFRLSEPDYQVKIELKGLLRGDIKTRALFYDIRFKTGSLTPNEIRTLEDETLLPEPAADQAYIPVNNLVPLSMVNDYFINTMKNGKE